MSGIFAQLKRRNVFRVAAAYVIVGWIVLQVGDLLFGMFGAPGWVGRSLAIVLLLGFPIACVFAWAFELTPEGVKRTVEVDEAASITARTGRKLDLFILVSLVALIGVTLWMRAGQQPSTPVEPSTPQSTVTEFSPEPRTNGIAVLPFVNMSDDPAQVYFSDGISEEILNVLAGIDGLRVASRTSAFAFKDSPLRLPEIAAELGVTFILEGSVRKAANQVRITAQLIDTRDDRHLWSDTFDRSLEDIFAIQSEIATAIGAALLEPLGIDVTPVRVAEITGNMDAYALYLEGRTAFIGRNSRQTVDRAITLLEQSVALDERFAKAWQYLAAAYGVAPYWGSRWDQLERYVGLAQEAIARALELDPDDALSYAVRGWLTRPLEAGWFAAALPDLDRAFALDPNQPDVLNWRGQLYQQAGLMKRSLADQDRCLELEPGYFNCMYWRSLALFLLGQREAAIQNDVTALRIGVSDEIPGDVAWYLALHGPVVAMVYGRSLPGWQNAPLAEWVDAMQGTNADLDLGLRKWDAWSKSSGQEVPAPVLASLGAWDRIALSLYEEHFWMWLPMYREFRSSDAFRRYVEDVGMLTVWKQVGFPEWCRPLGENDFACD